MPHENVLVAMAGGVLLNGAYIGPSKSQQGLHLVEAENGQTISVAPDKIIPLAREIRVETGCILVTSERGQIMLRHMPDEKTENDFMDMWNGKLGLEVVSRIDLARHPIVTKEGEGLK